jgi:hypothetical protein
MTKDALWKQYVERNPNFEGVPSGNVTMTRRGLKKLFDQVWEVAHRKGVQEGRTSELVKAEVNSLFGRIFGPSFKQ